MKTLTKSDYEAASQMIGCEVETIQAIINIEFPDPGFILDGDKNRLALRFNRQRFHHFTEGVHDKRNSISSPKPDVKPRHKSYDGRILAEIERFNEAEKLDEAAAKRAALWGRFRIEGFLHRACGYSTIDGMIADFARAGEPAQLSAWILWAKTQGLADDLRRKDWISFARHFNGMSTQSDAAALYEAEYARLIAERAEARKESPAVLVPSMAEFDLMVKGASNEWAKVSSSDSVTFADSSETFSSEPAKIEADHSSSYKVTRAFLITAFLLIVYGVVVSDAAVIIAALICMAIVVAVFVLMTESPKVFDSIE